MLELRDILAKQLEEVSRLEAVLEDSAALAKVTLPMKDHEEDLWRVRGVQDLKPEALSLLREINHLREQIAMNRNVPPFKVFSDRLMIEVAQTQPHYLEELALLPSFSPAMMRRYSSQIMQTVERWRRNPPVPVKPRKITRLSDRELKLRDKLTNWRKAVGEKEGIPSNAVFPRDLLERIAHYDPTSMEALEEVMEDYPHRFQKYGPRIFNLIKGKRNETDHLWRCPHRDWLNAPDRTQWTQTFAGMRHLSRETRGILSRESQFSLRSSFNRCHDTFSCAHRPFRKHSQSGEARFSGGPIYATNATIDLADIMLRDSGHIQENDITYLNKKRRKKGKRALEPIYTQKDAIEAMPFSAHFGISKDRSDPGRGRSHC